MRNAKCGMAMRGRSRRETPPAIPHSAFRIPHLPSARTPAPCCAAESRSTPRRTHPPHADPLDGHLTPACDLAEAALLHGVIAASVELDRPAVVARQREHAGVLPR